MSDNITVRGLVATDVRLNMAENSGLQIASFRLCSTDRRYDRDKGSWVDGQTNWYSVSMFRYLAANAAFSLNKGDRVVVTGRLKVRPWTDASGRSGTSVDIDADSVGHDLAWGTARFTRHTSEKDDQSRAAHDLSDGGSAGVPDDVDPFTGEMTEPEATSPDVSAEGAAKEPVLAGAEAPF